MGRQTTIISPDTPFGDYVRRIFISRRVLSFLIGREILSRYRQTTFGLLWAAFQPLSMMLILSFVYRHYLPTGNVQVPYTVFVLAGLLPWQLFARTLESASVSLLQHRSLITKIYIPRIFIPLSMSVAGLIDAAFGIVILLVVMACYGMQAHWGLLLLPVFLLYSFYCALGLGLMLAVLNVQYRDVQYVVPFIVRLTFFIAPVSYPASAIPRELLPVYFLNPLAGALELVQWSVAGGSVYGAGVLISLAVSTVFFLAGLRIFQKMEFRVADLI